jgi:hypothetical protein
MESTTGYCPPVWDLLLALALDAQVQGTTVFSLIQQILLYSLVHKFFVYALAGIEPAHQPLTYF